MKKLSTIEKILSGLAQVIAALIFAGAAYGKFAGLEASVAIFHSLGMDETRLIIGAIEGLTALLLLTNSLAHYGAILGFGTMIGALIAHVSVLGLVVHGDRGVMVGTMAIVIISTLVIMWIRRRKLPLVGHTFK